ncbi:hypothetical protein J2W69_004068 [Rheinheimera soli]|uniref:Uncharacterized protein n=1 Tax=Rheinheimera soli TaxID=443616 RepID=A0ABU1W5H4_9GAMM|nr:hypothetical protein [Rheinheimera soli]
MKELAERQARYDDSRDLHSCGVLALSRHMNVWFLAVLVDL